VRRLRTLVESNRFRVARVDGIGRVPWLWKSMLMVASRA